MNRQARDLARDREIQALALERDEARRNLERVVAQRDELRRVLRDLRSYARQEAERAVDENMKRRGRTLVDYVWPDPGGAHGWIDAWNGWYPTEAEAREQGVVGLSTRPRVLKYGEGLVDEEEAERRLALIERMRPTVALAAHLDDPEPVVPE